MRRGREFSESQNQRDRSIGNRESAGSRDPVDRCIRNRESEEAGLTDYRSYPMRGKDIALCGGGALILSAMIAWLFYHHWIGMAVFAVIAPVAYHLHRREQAKMRQGMLRDQFKECIRVVTASMHVGYSVENAFGEAEKELIQLLGSQADMCQELRMINRQIRLNVPIEKLLGQLAVRSGVEEIFGFGQVFGYAKRSGSDFLRILQDTVERIAQKAELEQEIRTMIAAKQMEQRIMNVIPLGILFFIDLTSPEFLEMMYAGMFGRICMTICLLVYGVAYLLSRKIVDIRI